MLRLNRMITSFGGFDELTLFYAYLKLTAFIED